MNGRKNISAWQFALFRIAFGTYLAWHFLALAPYGTELFSAEGMLPRASLNITYRAFPNLLAWADAPWQVTAFIVILGLVSIAFALGWHRRSCAVLLWYGWACLFNRNNLISNPGIPYVGLLLLFCVLVPSGEPLRLKRKSDPNWAMPAFVYWGAWFLLVAGYSYSGIWKALSPSWQDGSALHHLITNPLARPGIFRDLVLALPPMTLACLTWLALAGELTALPLSLFRQGRFITWTWMLIMHLGILLVVDFADLTMGMLMIHLFTFDPDWLRPKPVTNPIFLFDGACGLCNRAVQFFVREDAHAVLRFAALQSSPGREFLARHGLTGIDSMVLLEHPGTPAERAFTASDAALRACVAIGGFWKLFAIWLLIPKPFRDAIYQYIARKRHEWFDAEPSCALPEGRVFSEPGKVF